MTKYIKLLASSLSTLLILSFAFTAQATIRVVTTLPDLAALARAVGGDNVSVESIAKGTQDPHAIEAKPSYMVKLSRADLVIAGGLSLEKAWLDSLILGARNPKINHGTNGYLELGPQLHPIEVPTGSVSRALGDVHPEGNPHFYLDPVRMGEAASIIADRLGELDPTHANDYTTRAKTFANHMKKKVQEWQTRLKKTGIDKVITYHSTLNYFLKRFGIRLAGELEPKPGIPPTAPHIMEIMDLIRKEKVHLILIENYFDAHVADRITQEIPGVRIVSVPVAVGGEPGIDTTEQLMDRIVKAFEGDHK